MKWERISDEVLKAPRRPGDGEPHLVNVTTDRMEVPCGFLVRTILVSDAGSTTISTVFVPDVT